MKTMVVEVMEIAVGVMNTGVTLKVRMKNMTMAVIMWYPILNASNVCVCVSLLLLNRYLDFDGNCRKLTVIIRSNYSAYFEVGGTREGEKRGRIGDFIDLLARLASERTILHSRIASVECELAVGYALYGLRALQG